MAEISIPGYVVVQPDPDVLAPTTSQSSVTQYGITWTFDTTYEVGQFVTGDYFVVDPGAGVTVSSVSPAPTGSGATKENGSTINPSSSKLGYDGRLAGYLDASTVTYPATLSTGDSLVSTESTSLGGTDVTGTTYQAGHAYLLRAAALTVVSTVPYADSLRPPFVGATKTTYRTSSFNRSVLPSVSITSKPATSYVDTIAGWFSAPWLDHITGTYNARFLHPAAQCPNYGREWGTATSIASGLLLLDYTEAEKEELLINFVQLGIDLYHSSETGTYWDANGGHGNGRKWPILLAGLILNNTGMKNVSVYFAENLHSWYGTTASLNAGQANVAYFGIQPGYYAPWDTTLTDAYYQAGCTGGGAKDVAPSTLDDDACQDYRNCCTLYTWVGYTMMVRLMSQQTLWNHDPFFDLVDRWMDYGNDPVVGPGDFIDAGATPHAFITDLWNTYRSSY